MKTFALLPLFLMIFSAVPVLAAEDADGFLELTPAWRQSVGFRADAGAGDDFAWRFGRFARAAELLSLDRDQTLLIKNRPGIYEINPVLGRRPSDGRINAYFAGVGALIFLGTVKLPEPLASSLIDSVHWTQKLVTESNQRLFLTGRGGGLPIAAVYTIRF